MMNAIGIVKTLVAGDDVDTKCGKCKDIRSHVIVALNEAGQIARVRCGTCKGEHNYKAPSDKPKRAASTRSPRSSDLVASGPTKIYSTQQRFKIGDQISHPTFGLGLVHDVREKKIDVKFGRDAKVLIHLG